MTVFIEREGKRESVSTLAPVAKADAEFPARAMAVFRNASAGERAKLSITVRGNTRNLGRRYERKGVRAEGEVASKCCIAKLRHTPSEEPVCVLTPVE